MMRTLLVPVIGLLAAVSCGSAKAERIANPIALFAGLDKITGVTTSFEIPIGEERRFGGVIVRPEVCYTRPVTEQPKTTSFVRVTSNPQAAARFSFSRIASMTAPSGELRMREISQIANTIKNKMM